LRGWRLRALPVLVCLIVASAAGAARGVSVPVRTFRVAPQSVDPNGSSAHPSVSSNGRFIAFDSTATNLGSSGATGIRNAFVFDAGQQRATLVSVGLGGGLANGDSTTPSISANGLTVAFASRANNLVAGDHGHRLNIFVRVAFGPILKISRRSDGGQADGDSYQPVVSGNGRYVAFTSSADDLIQGDDNGVSDVFEYDLLTKTIKRVSVSRRGRQANDGSAAPSISADGRYVSFASGANNLVPGGRKHVAGVFVRDTVMHTTKRVSVSSRGRAQNESVPPPYTQISALSADGRYVVFDSSATNLVRHYGLHRTNVYRHDMKTGATILVSRSTLGRQGDNDSFSPSVSADGNTVVFDSYATNLAGPWAPLVNVYARNIAQQTTLILDVAPNGGPRDSELTTNFLQRPAISGTGLVAVFTSGADNLVAGDHNGANDVFLRLITPPTTTLVTSPGAHTRDRRPRVEFRGDDPDATFGVCLVDRRRTLCPAGHAFRLRKLRKGSHKLSIFAGGPGMLFDPVGVTVRFKVQ
jgi:Tol biopolymer transport system component